MKRIRYSKYVPDPAGEMSMEDLLNALSDYLLQSGFQGYATQFFWGFVASAISGFVVIWFLLRYLRRHDFLVFMVYRVAVAALILLLIATGIRSATI